MKLGIIGCGKMGMALLKGVLASNFVSPSNVLVNDRYAASVDQAVGELHVLAAGSNKEIGQSCDVIILCTKPNDVPHVLAELRDSKRPSLLISIAAGIKLKDLEAGLNASQRVIRVMPNTPALICKGASAYALGSRATPEDGELCERILQGVGLSLSVPEKQLDPVTGLSGSGPAYVYTIIDAMADGGVAGGLSKAQALQLAAQTVMGAAAMVLETGKHPALLRDEVCSPGGTTISGMVALEEGNLRHALISAVKAATQRSIEMGNPPTKL